MDSPTTATLRGRDIPPWKLRARVMQIMVEGTPVKLSVFTVGALAMALNRQVVTIRKWEAVGWIPKPRLRHKYGTRYYTEAQIEGLVQLAEKHGVLDPRWRRTPPLDFVREAFSLFEKPLV